MPQTFSGVLNTCSRCGTVAPGYAEDKLPRGWIYRMTGEGTTPADTNWMRSAICPKHRDDVVREDAATHLVYLKQEAAKLGYMLICTKTTAAADLMDEAMNAERAARRQQEGNHA